MKSTDLFTTVIAAGIPYANHESDLYIPVTDETRKLIAAYEFKENVTTFTNQVEGGLWYDIPFAYLPRWERDLKSRDATMHVIKQRIALAEFLEPHKYKPGTGRAIKGEPIWIIGIRGRESPITCPDFTTNTDEVRNIEARLSDAQMKVYADHLVELCTYYSRERALISAPANIRCIALLKTLNLWKVS